MIKIHQWITTAGGIGFIGKGAGTIAAIALCVACYLLPIISDGGWLSAILAIAITALGVYSSGKVEAAWGKDSNKVVIDEVAGMMVTLVFIPVTINNLLVGLLLFRFFDILKPLYIKKAENLPGGWGVMADDILAGLYAHIVLAILVNDKLL